MFPPDASTSNASVSNRNSPMKPLIYLKSFLAALLILIVSGSLLVAYFRNFSPGVEGHEHGDRGTDDHAAGQSRKEDDHAAAPAHQPLTSDAESSHH